jgi:glycosyltransferase involved in cell wall biosynthesis
VDRTAEQLQDKLKLISGIRMHIVAPSQWLAGIVAGSQVGEGWRIHTIPNGVDPAQFAPGERNSNLTTILIVNRDFSDSRKGYPMVKEALSMIDPNGVRLVLAGQGSAVAAVELSLRFDCRDAGYVRDRLALAALYAEADIFLFASEAENFPCVILEAMASECCVVATPTGGVVEQIENGRSGILASAISGNALRDALRVAVADAALRVRLGKSARERVIDNFSEERMVSRYLALYEEVLGGS